MATYGVCDAIDEVADIVEMEKKATVPYLPPSPTVPSGVLRIGRIPAGSESDRR